MPLIYTWTNQFRAQGLTLWFIKLSHTKPCPKLSRASLIAQMVKNPPAMQKTPVRSLDQEDRWRRDRLPTPVFLGFPCSSAGKESTCNVGILGSTPGVGKFPWRRERLPTLVFWPGESIQSMGSQRVRLDWATFAFTLNCPRACQAEF